MSDVNTNIYYGTDLFTLVDRKPPIPKKKISQFKEVDPSFSEQMVTPDQEYYYLSAVRVNPISYTSTPNAYGGVTIRIGGG